MEQSQKKKKKKDSKPIFIFLALLIFFGAFIYLLIRPSLQSKAIDQIQICSNINEVKSIYEQYKFELLEVDENNDKIVAIEFQNAVRDKLNSFKPNEQEITKCLEWLPPAKTSLNVIVIPDLSNRITNIPGQITNDKLVLKTIWHSFAEGSKLKQNTKDRLLVDVTDIDQAKGQFEEVANELQFDLSLHKGKSNRLYFTEEKDKQFDRSINSLYQSAAEKPLGADYWFYFKRYLTNHLKKSNLYDNYINKVVIITDGYIETGEKDYTKHDLDELKKSVNIGNTKDVIALLGLNIPNVQVDLSNTDILICEVRERETGKKVDFEILKVYWEDWMQRMNAHSVNVVQREQASELTRSRIKDFLKN